MARSYRIAEWNINHAAHVVSVPQFVCDEIKNLAADIVIITEYVQYPDDHFLHETFLEQGYEYAVTSNYSAHNHHNEVLIAWRAEAFTLVDEYTEINKRFKTTSASGNPNFLVLKLKERHSGGCELIIAGVRITTEEELFRRIQMENALNQLNHILEADPDCAVVMAGDYNNFRRGYLSPENQWDLSEFLSITCQKGYQACIPEGSSIYGEECCSKEYEFPEDRFVVKNCRIGNNMYDRTFTAHYPQIYCNGHDFQRYDRILNRVIWKIRCGSGIPDHAILTGTLSF